MRNDTHPFMSDAVATGEAAAAQRTEPRRHVAGRASRFAAVGVVGFGVDAAVLSGLVLWLGLDAFAARLVSFMLAVLSTYLLNRRFTFAGPAAHGAAARTAEYVRYLVVQVLGAAANLGVYAAAIAMQPALAAIPVVPLAIGAVAGLVVNLSGSRLWVFGVRRR
jgi:putative flippase GtrA